MKNPHLFIIQPRQDIILLCELIEITRHQENKMGHLFLCFFSFIMISSTLQLMSTQLLLLRNEVRSIEGEEETDCDESRREEQIGGEKRRWCRLRLQKLMLKSLCPSSRDVLI